MKINFLEVDGFKTVKEFLIQYLGDEYEPEKDTDEDLSDYIQQLAQDLLDDPHNGSHLGMTTVTAEIDATKEWWEEFDKVFSEFRGCHVYWIDQQEGEEIKKFVKLNYFALRRAVRGNDDWIKEATQHPEWQQFFLALADLPHAELLN